MPARSSRMHCILLIAILEGIYFLENYPLFSFNKKMCFIYVVRPALWVGAAIVVWLFPRVRPKGLLRLRNFVNWWAFNFAIFHILLMIGFALLVDGFGKSPYDHSLLGIGFNIFSVGILLISRETIRNYFVNSLSNHNSLFMIILISLLMTISTISLNRWINLRETEQIVKYIGEYFLPQFSQNIFASYLVLFGGSWASIIYLGIMQAFEWFSPILPNLKWINNALIGILYPVFSLMFFQNLYLKESKTLKKDKKEENPIGWVLTSVISIGVLWFSVGVFSIYPIVIATGSMEPMIYAGDVVLIKRIETQESKIGEVIQFSKNGISICHRISGITEEEKQRRYITKGDNNTKEDAEWVRPEEIKGTVICVIPKIGWPTLFIKQKN